MATFGSLDNAASNADLSQADIAITQADIQVAVGNVNPTKPLSTTNVQDVYAGYTEHASAKRIVTELAITNAIRAVHPNCDVKSVSRRSCELIGFAKAGHAELQLQTEGDRYLIERVYDAPPNRLQGGHGSLRDSVIFGHYCIVFEGHTFQFYVASWPEKYMGIIKKCFIVSSKEDRSIEPSGAGTVSPAVDRLVLAASKWSSELHGEVYVYDDGDWDKNKKLWAAVQSSTWDDVILDPSMKETLISDVQNFFDSRPLYEEYAVPWKRGIIFHGTPGCGKTISIKALMNTLDKREQPVASLYVKTLQNCRGLHYSIREIFSKAREMAPCLLVFEDLDSLVVDKVRSYFLNEVDGLEENDGILMIGSTNHLERLDPGISKRPSRFDRKYHFRLPGARERVLYCEYWKKKLERNSNVDFDQEICDVVAELTDGFSFAYLKELFVQTLLTIVGGRQSELDDEEDGEEYESSEGELVEIADATKVVEGSGSVVVGDGKVTSTAGGDKQTDVERISNVRIPERLQSNALMRVLRKQALSLWKDMDNTKDEEAGKKKKKGAKGDGDENGSDSEEESDECESC